MAIYYVRNSGNNSNSGTGYTSSLAWGTISKAVSTIAAGDTVYIAPGTYREIITLATAGTSASTITWYGDTNCNYFTDMKSGYVRVTGANSSEIGSGTTYIINSNGKAYNDFYNLVVDGNKTNQNSTYCRAFNGTSTGNAYNCMGSAAYSAFYGFKKVSNCFGVAYVSFFSNTNVSNCISIGGLSFNTNGTVDNCIAIGGTYGFNSNTTNRNCSAYSSNYGFGNGNHINCVSYGCFYGFGGNSTATTIVNGKAINCYTAAYGNSTSLPLNISGVSVSSCVTNSRGSGYDIGSVTETKYEGYYDISKILKLSTALKFDLFESNNGVDQTFSDNYDILMHPRKMGNGVIDIGAFEYSNISLDWSDYYLNAPCIKINNIGYKRIVIPVKKSISKKISCWTKYNLDGGTQKPQLIISSSEDCLITNPLTITATGSGISYEQLSTTIVPKADGLIFINLYNRESGSTSSSYAYFSDFII